ncbi:hypothetical protein C1645_820392 [Glomus cerebriforme]|uniref:Uncharacterized protein n=1 Tax=Glomus cerebriforme TaxID=658196 RepID=A0A397T6Y9_9GLOM|nr:hypothetical protein C1645_820392 [Glomus cerebriforme]
MINQLLYSEVAQHAISLNIKQEKKLYSKEHIAKSIKQVKELEKNCIVKTTILARDKEVVAVRLEVLPDICKIYLSKNFAWTENDIKYIDKIANFQFSNFLKDISSNASMILTDVELIFTKIGISYCSGKLKTRLRMIFKAIVMRY